MTAVYLFTLASLLLVTLHADEAISSEQPKTTHSRELLPELRIAYFYPTSNKLRKIYHTGILYSAEFGFQVWNPLYLWANVGYLHKAGHTSGYYKTHITFAPFSLGLKYMYRVSWIDFYLGLGVLGAYVHTQNQSPYLARNIKRWCVGGIAKAGFLAYAAEDVFFDFFVDYSYLQVGYNGRRINLHKSNFNNVASGVGIGYRF